MLGQSSNQSGGVLGVQLDLLGGSWQNPLAVTYPGIAAFFNYPLFVTNVKLLCENRAQKEKEAWSSSKQNSSSSSSFQATFRSLRHTYRCEGLLGLYCGAHLYVLHLSAKEGLRFLADRGVRALERKAGVIRGGEGENAEDSREDIWWWRLRMAVKYMIDAVCYPILLTTTRGIVLRDSPLRVWHHIGIWCKEEGFLSLFSGMTSSLMSTACDEAMDMLLAICIDRCAAGTNVDVADKLLLKASGSSVVSIFTSPINYVGVIQRCQSQLPGLLEPGPVLEVLRSLPWRASFNQLLIFSSILALNVKVAQWKLELKAEEENSPD